MTDIHSSTSDVARHGRFTTTHWSVVLSAADPNSAGSMDAFAQLYRDYWFPLYAYVRRRGRSPEQAEDLTQDFFATLLERQRLARVDRAGGRFRSFLLTSLQNFLSNDWDRSSAQKRGGGRVVASLDEMQAEARFVADTTIEPPEAAFERHWAYEVISNAMRALEREMETAGRTRLLEMLRSHLQGDRVGRPYGDIATDLGMSEGAVKVAVHRLRQRYGELLRAEVARTVDNPTEVEAEWRHLIAVVTRSGGSG